MKATPQPIVGDKVVVDVFQLDVVGDDIGVNVVVLELVGER